MATNKPTITNTSDGIVVSASANYPEIYVGTSTYGDISTEYVDVNITEYTVPGADGPLEITPGFFRRALDTTSSSDQLAVLFNKPIQDTARPTDDFYGETNADDDQTAGVSKMLLDYSSLSDAAVLIVTFLRTIQDDYILIENVSLTVEFNRIFSDFSVATDDVLGEANLDDDQTAFFNKSLVNVYTVTDPVTSIVSFNRSVQDITTYTDIHYFGIKPAYFNAINSNDTALTTVDFNRLVQDASIQTDTSYFDVNANYSDISNITDGLNSIVDFNRLFSDLVVGTDDVLGEANLDDDQTAFFNKSVVNSYITTDEVNTLLSFVRLYTETNNILDNDYSFSLSTVYQELNTIQDQNIALSTAKPVQNIYSASDEYFAVDLNVAIFEVVTADGTDASTLNETIFRIDPQISSAADLVVTTTDFNREYLDTYQTSSDIDFNIQPVVLDAQSISDNNYFDVLAVYQETQIVRDEPQTVADYNRLFTDLVLATDDVLGEANLDDDQTAFFNKAVINSYSIQDNVSPVLNFVREIADTQQLNDLVSFAGSKALLNTQSIADTATSTWDITRAENESLTMSQTVTFDISRVFANQTQTQEVVTGVLLALKQETVLTNETRTANIQDYFLEDYVVPGYVGTNLTL